MSWNVESGGADATTIGGQIAAFDGVDLWGVSEVNDDGDANLYETGAEVGEAACWGIDQFMIFDDAEQLTKSMPMPNHSIISIRLRQHITRG